MKLPFNNVLLIDGSNLLHRAYHTHLYLKSSDGTPSGAVYGAIESLYSYVAALKPLQIAVGLDCVRESFRNEIYPLYKGNRSEREEALQVQFELFKEYLHAANIPCLDEVEYEADDLLGSMAQSAVTAGYSPYVLSGDGDMLQLITDQINVLAIKKDRLEMIDKAGFAEKYNGLVPSQLIEIKALQGDTSDNIPGVRGIGEKTAIKLISDYHNLEGLYANVEDLKGKMKEKIIEDKDNAFLSRQLATIKTDIPLEFPDQKIFNFHTREARAFLDRLDIRTL